MAAVLASGGGAVVSHLDAAAAQRIWSGPRGLVEVTLTRSSSVARGGIVAHRSRRLTAADIEIRDGIPLTSLPRTLLDIAPEVGPVGLREAIGKAQRLRRLRVPALEQLLARTEGDRGAAILAAATAELRSHGGVTRRLLERKFLARCRKYGLPRPIVNGLVRVAGRSVQVDFHWPAARLVVETDGYEFHSDIVAHDEDRRRDQDLKLAAWDVLRFSWSQVYGQPKAVAAIVREMLAADRPQAESGVAARSRPQFDTHA